MKKYALCLLFMSSLVHAQEKKPAEGAHPFRGMVMMGAGFMPVDQMFAGFKTHYKNDVQTGALFITAKTRFSKSVLVGLLFAYEHERGTWSRNAPRVYGSFNRECITIAPEVTVTMGSLADGKIQIYNTYGVGMTSRKQQTTWENNTGWTGIAAGHVAANVPNPRETHVTAHVSLLGLRFGRKLAGFTELSIGYKGLVNAGLAYMF